VRFDRIRLENFRPYADADLRLDRGVSVVHGPNGSGKSSLLEACFFALYGAKALDRATLDDVVTEGEDEATIDLWFTHDGESYRVRRRLRATADRTRTAECVLETPEGSIEGARAVREWVRGALRMDAGAFVNCAYVRQGEVNKLIHASPGERQDVIDDLLQLGKLEEYRERASQARLGVEDVMSGQREVVQNLDEQIQRKERKDLPASLNRLETERNEVVADIERIETQVERAETTRDDATEILRRHEQRREELAELDDEIEALREAIGETERERDELESTILEKTNRLADRKETRGDLLAAVESVPGNASGGGDGGEVDVDGDADGDLDADPDVDAQGSVDADRGVDVTEAIESLGEQDDRLRDRIEELTVERSEATSEAERRREQADELDDEAAEKRSEADELEAAIAEAESSLAERRERLADLDEQIADVEDRFEDAPVEFGESESHRSDLANEREQMREEATEVEAELEARRERVAEAEALLEAGKCPECGQAVDDSPHVDRLDEDRERVEELESSLSSLREELSELDDRIDRAESLVEAERERDRLASNREDLQQLIAETAASIETDRDRAERLRERAAELADEANEERAGAAEAESRAEDLREQIAAANADRVELDERIDRLERIRDLDDEIDALEDDIERLRERRRNKAELNDERRERLAEKRERRSELREKVDEDRIRESREEKQRAESYLERASEELAELRPERDELKERIGGVRAELEQLRGLRERREEVETRRSALSDLYDEVRTLQETYGDLRADLRQRNVERLERLLNETFELVYANDSYARIELDGNYQLTVYQKDGRPLDPEQLSGGERALFNLSLRTAIYRLLAEGIEGTAPLPPLILDEPTVFLDSGHVSRLIDLVEEMRGLGVEQIIVVTHDEELIGAADSVVRVTKDPTTNRSSVERVDVEGVVAP